MLPELNEAIQASLAQWEAQRSTERLWAKDATLWAEGAGPWLGWLDVATPERATLEDITRRAKAVAPHASDVLLIGMGGSSLAPEVIAQTIPRTQNGRTIHVLDSTEPSYVRATFARTDWTRTIILVASKSGSTLEPDILLSAALAAAREVVGDDIVKHCIAITDPNSKLAKQAAELKFAETFAGEPTIGGRFSALSPFGLVPAALHGVDLHSFVGAAARMAQQCNAPAHENPGVQLGTYLAECTKHGRDKCTLVLPRSLASLGAWIEQLIAESTGKHGIAVLPIAGETLGAASVYGDDRSFVHVRQDDSADAAVNALGAAGHPVFTIEVTTVELAAEFFRWEFATAVAGSLLGINPFDQPDVESAKIETRKLTDAYERGERPAIDAPNSIDELKEFLDSLHAGDYFGILAFLPMFADVRASVERMRMRVRDAHRVATTVGFGPRFLHSTGQAFKGGPNTGVFLQLTCEPPVDVPVPGRKLTFGTVVSAQAAGDRAVLRARGRRVMHLHLSGELHAELAKLEAAVNAATA